jgi:tRNA dimethylallyltransferase
MGPTGSGKSDLAERLAERYQAQLLNADAFQVYRGLDIGTGKSALKEKYELLDICNPWQQFGVGLWVSQAGRVLEKLFSSGRPAVVVGGTGLYVRALFEGYSGMSRPPDESLRTGLNKRAESGTEALMTELEALDADAARAVDRSNTRRVVRALERALSNSTTPAITLPPFRRIKVSINPPREVLLDRIDARINAMFRSGWLDEVRGLRTNPRIQYDSPGMQAIGYRALWDHLDQKVGLEAARESILIATRQYAKRQRTWLRKEPGLISLEWAHETEDVLRVIEDPVGR